MKKKERKAIPEAWTDLVNFICELNGKYYISAWEDGGLYMSDDIEGIVSGDAVNINKKNNLGIKGIQYYVTEIDGFYYITDILSNNGIMQLEINEQGELASDGYVFDFSTPVEIDDQRKNLIHYLAKGQMNKNVLKTSI